MFKKFIAQQIADKVSDIPESTSIGDANAYAEEIIMAIEEANESLKIRLNVVEEDEPMVDGTI